MSTVINTFQLESLISNDLRDHGYYPWCSLRMKKSQVSPEEVFGVLLDPDTSFYIKERMNAFNGKTIFQANATLVNMMFYAIYTGYLYAHIMEDESYNKDIWSYPYMHEKLGGHIYEPIFISLLPQLFDYTMPEDLEELYSKDSIKVFNLIYRWIYSFVSTYKLDKGNLYVDYDKEDDFYLNELPKSLSQLHDFGTAIFYALSKDKTNRLFGKTLLSTNLQMDLNQL